MECVEMAKINLLKCEVIQKYEGTNDIETIYANFISIKLSNSFEDIESKLKIEGDDAYEN